MRWRIVASLLISVVLLSGCSSVEKRLVGKWYADGVEDAVLSIYEDGKYQFDSPSGWAQSGNDGSWTLADKSTLWFDGYYPFEGGGRHEIGLRFESRTGLGEVIIFKMPDGDTDLYSSAPSAKGDGSANSGAPALQPKSKTTPAPVRPALKSALEASLAKESPLSEYVSHEEYSPSELDSIIADYRVSTASSPELVTALEQRAAKWKAMPESADGVIVNMWSTHPNYKDANGSPTQLPFIVFAYETNGQWHFIW